METPVLIIAAVLFVLGMLVRKYPNLIAGFNMDLAGIYHKANILIAQTYGITGVPEKGYVIVTVNNVRYIVYFYKIESGWNIEKVEECL